MRTLLKYVGFWFLCVFLLGMPFCGFFAPRVDWMAPVIPFLAVAPAALFTHLHNRRAERKHREFVRRLASDYQTALALESMGEHDKAANLLLGLPAR